MYINNVKIVKITKGYCFCGTWREYNTNILVDTYVASNTSYCIVIYTKANSIAS